MSQNPYPGERAEWTWEAHYIDGTVLYQEGNKIRSIEQDRLLSFHMVNEEKTIVIHWRPWYKLIHFYRHLIKHDAIGETRYLMYCFGYQNGDAKTIMAIMPDGNIVVTDNIDTVRIHV